ncbi:MAG: hypothetical protein QOI39_4309 [Mycobacterium sp.]|jgi:hypothetical protein|nr:hypothetical protein [Mycobacterium sp.]
MSASRDIPLNEGRVSAKRPAPSSPPPPRPAPQARPAPAAPAAPPAVSR